MPTKDSKYNPWWARVVFDEFCSHYFSMTNEEKVTDINESIKALLSKDDTGQSFGSRMVRLAKERIETNRETKGVHGSLGGRPPTPPQRINQRKPGSREEFKIFVADNNLNIDHAEGWYEIHSKRNWTDSSGKPLTNWKGALTQYCRTKEQKDNEREQYPF